MTRSDSTEQRILVKFLWTLSQQGKVQGTFITTRAQLEDAYGRRASFGDILGEYSEVAEVLSKSDFSVVTEDQEFIDKYEKYIGATDGYNPLEHI
jgi:hypothetical protein